MLKHSSHYKVNRQHQKKRSLLPALILLGFACVASLVIAMLWQNADGWEHAWSLTSQTDQSEISPVALVEPMQMDESSLAPEPPKPEPTPAERALRDGVVSLNDRVNSSYFDDAVFIGDSITTGIQLYDVLSGAHVLAANGINLDSIYSKEVIKQDDGSLLTIMDSLSRTPYKKVYAMLGGNEIRDVDKEAYIRRYGAFIDDLKKLQPDADIYIQSVLPVTADNTYGMENDRIDEYNLALQDLCKEKKIYYLNVAECMKDENGELPSEASPNDGMHFVPAYYNEWFEYLKTHTV